MMACTMEKIISLWENIFKLGFHYVGYGLIFFTLWNYVFPMMACPMGKIIPLWDQYFEIGNL